MMAKITLLENDVSCLNQRNDEEPPFEGDYHDEEISHRSVSRNLCADTEFSKEDGKMIKKEQNNMVLMLPLMMKLTFQTAHEEKKECIANLKYPATPVMMMT
ncbi:hypothetical protein MKW92_052263 [Papaver armeniacum]|nr:hypothetical protein MKW92_052263 [Papaver armeniacum]